MDEIRRQDETSRIFLSQFRHTSRPCRA